MHPNDSHQWAMNELTKIAGAEYAHMSRYHQRLVVRDFLDTIKSEDCPLTTYARRIGHGNMQSYANCMAIREQKGWDV